MADQNVFVDELTLEQGTALSPAQVQEAIDDVIAKLKDRKVERVTSIQQTDYAATKGEGAGVIEVIIISFAGALAKEVAQTLWKEVIWPSLKVRFGNKVKSKSE